MNLSVISQVLFYLGISVGITCASKLPTSGEIWPDTLIPFIISIVVTIVGLVGWRWNVSASSQDDNSPQETNHPQYLLDDLQKEIEDLAGFHQNASLSEIQSKITYLLERFFIPITNQQQLVPTTPAFVYQLIENDDTI